MVRSATFQLAPSTAGGVWTPQSLSALNVLITHRFHRSGPYYPINTMNLELVGQLISVFLILGAGPIVIVLLYARGGNL